MPKKTSIEEPPLSEEFRRSLSTAKQVSFWLLVSVVITTATTKWLFGEAPLGADDGPIARFFVMAAEYATSWQGLVAIGLLGGILVSTFAIQILVKHDLFQQARRLRGLREVETLAAVSEFAGVAAVPKFEWSDGEGEQADLSSPLNEAANSIAAMLLPEIDKTRKRVLFTSAAPSEGKTTLSRAVSRALDRMGCSTVIIDADLRRPRHHLFHGHALSPGLSDFRGKSTLDDIVKEDKSHPAVKYIPAGQTELSPPAVLADLSRRGAWEVIAANFDAVIVDGPPVIGLADAVLLAREVDLIVFVVEEKRTNAKQIGMALARLQPNESRTFAVLNKLTPDAGYYYSAYSYYYPIGESENTTVEESGGANLKG